MLALRSCRAFGLTRGCSSTAAAAYFPAVKTPMLPPGTFEGKIAIVTGGGTGLGRGIVELLSALGAKVVICSRKLSVLESAAQEISESSGNEVFPIAMDVRDPEAVKTVADECVSKCGGLPHIVVNNAAGNFISPTERLSSNAFRTVVDIVLNGSANVTLEFGKRLIEAKQGANFLSITTTYTKFGSGYVVPSAAAKAGLEAMTMSLAAEWGKYGMRFNAIAPGPIETKGAFTRLDPMGQLRQRFLEALPVGRLGGVEEHANLATYILSDYASWLTGSVIVFDGGNLPYMSGMFNDLTKLPKTQWDAIEAMIRKTKDS